MEGPSIYLAAEQIVLFRGKKVRIVSGNTKVGKEVFLNKKVLDIFPWGKHLVFQFDKVAFRVHFLIFGTFEATVNGKSVTGDYKKAQTERLGLTFSNGNVKMFNCSIKIFETENLKSTYDFTIDIMSLLWDPNKAFENVKRYPKEEIADVLLDQEIFAGVGNIIKNEILSILKINPKIKVSKLSNKDIILLIAEAKDFSHKFLNWRREFLLKKNLKIYNKSTCPHCQGKVTKQKTGKRNRWSYFCSICQPPDLHK